MTQLPYPATHEEAEALKQSWKKRGSLKRIEYMHAKFGEIKEHVCGECAHFRRYQQATTWFKCLLYGESGSASTDWRAKWIACGKFERSGDK